MSILPILADSNAPALIRSSPNLHKILQSHTFISTLHVYMYNCLQYNLQNIEIFPS